MTFVHLRVRSAYSLGKGAIRLKELIQACVTHQMPAVAVTDFNNLFGALEFSLLAAEAGVQPICGVSLSVCRTQPSPIGTSSSIPSCPSHDLLLLVQNQQGYQNLLSLASQAYLNSPSGMPPFVLLSDVLAHAQGLIVLTGSSLSEVGALIQSGHDQEAHAALQELQEAFGDRVYMELIRHMDPSDFQKDSHGKLWEHKRLSLSYTLGIPVVATNDAHFLTPDLFEAHDAFLCIAQGGVVEDVNRQQLTPHHSLKTPEQMAALFSDLPEALENTVRLAQRCHFRPVSSPPILPTYVCPPEYLTEGEFLRYQAEKGLSQRISSALSPHDQQEKYPAYKARLDHELKIIDRMGFSGYFLIVSDFIQWAKSQSIPVGPGRGSGAGSLVAWSLTITDIDPLSFQLLFERFLNPDRISMPDFDIDFCQDRRDEVIDYVRKKYGSDRVAQIITFGKLQARAVLRDVGRVLQMPYSQVDRISKLVPNTPANPVTLSQALALEPLLEEARATDPTVSRLIDMALKLEGLYRHASTHAAGVVIGDRPLMELVPLYKDDRSDFPATQFNMKYAELAGLIKFDFLGLKTLTVIQKCCDLLKKRHINLEISHIPLDDLKTFELLGRVETIGIFQLESGGMKDVLKKLRPDRFEDLIALVALYRPGPMDDIPRYLACKHGQEEVHYLHPDLEPILKPTYGVMVYQEQVMQIAQVLGGYTLGAADLLRRAMGKKIKSEMESQERLFMEGALSRGVTTPVAAQIFSQMAKFAGYGFNKSHSAPYALLTYQTAYLKANFPAEFYAASMTYEMQNTDKLTLFRQDLLQAGQTLFPPDVNRSECEFSVEEGGVRYGLGAIKNVGKPAMEALVQEREARGPFQSVEDFFARLETGILNKRSLENLIGAGALDSLCGGENKRSLLFHNIECLLKTSQLFHTEKKSNQGDLFGGSGPSTSLAFRWIPQKSWSPLDKLSHEFEALGFYLSDHPLSVYGDTLTRLSFMTSDILSTASDGESLKVAGVLLIKQERTSKTGQKFAFCQFSDAKGVFEVALFSEVYAKARDQLIPGELFSLRLLVRQEGDTTRLIAQSVEELDQTLKDHVKTLTLHVDESFVVSELAQWLSPLSGQGKTLLSLVVCLPFGRVSIRGVGVCAATKEERSALLSLPGVLQLSG